MSADVNASLNGHAPVHTLVPAELIGRLERAEKIAESAAVVQLAHYRKVRSLLFRLALGVAAWALVIAVLVNRA